MKNEERLTRKRLVINIDEEFHAELKAKAARKKLTITEYVMRHLIRGMLQEEGKQDKI